MTKAVAVADISVVVVLVVMLVAAAASKQVVVHERAGAQRRPRGVQRQWLHVQALQLPNEMQQATQVVKVHAQEQHARRLH
jgi:hypothetical protein